MKAHTSILTKPILLKIFAALDKKLSSPLNLIVGGAGALILAYQHHLGTSDIDAVPYKTALSLSEVDRLVKEIAKEFNLSPDWLNPYFQTFSHVLPKSYGERLILTFSGKYLQVYALGPEDLLILKCFAGREKDIGHVRLLMKVCKNLNFVSDHLQKLLDEKVPKAQEACDFFDTIKSDLGL